MVLNNLLVHNISDIISDGLFSQRYNWKNYSSKLVPLRPMPTVIQIEKYATEIVGDLR